MSYRTHYEDRERRQNAIAHYVRRRSRPERARNQRQSGGLSHAPAFKSSNRCQCCLKEQIFNYY
ncbi:hypothetical protein IQ247_06300 [Plectonema cf. radiosum LEGE 06105]|uniref:Uncharacterized protein n=1 Tax=Plectonema cf. radiosum LEGE 06105 TaxID=945769 RepID=A0A8J7FDM5_9CYAN|nr:hypothetical protein [Plectonema radiosum]MBE9212321.1 hypothetical protein [Plectonema cf. radiosum LEGE 06105]